MDRIRKRIALLSVILALPYLIYVIYAAVELFIAYGVQKENCPTGFIILPIFIWPALFIFWLKSYIGINFFRIRFNFKKFAKYAVVLLSIETAFWLFSYLCRMYIFNKWFFVFVFTNLVYYLYVFVLFFSKKEKLLFEREGNPFYLGFDIINAINLFMGGVFVIFAALELLSFKSLWIKDFPLAANIFNTGKLVGMISLIYPYFWCALNIKKFQNKTRRAQLAVSSLSVLEILTGSGFFTFLPIHIFSIFYLNIKKIRELFNDECANTKHILTDKSIMPAITLISVLVIVVWLLHYHWLFELNNTMIKKDYENIRPQMSKASDITDSLIKAENLYSEGKYKEVIEVLDSASSEKALPPFYILLIANSYGNLGDIEKAKPIGDVAIKFLSDDSAETHYNLACHYSIIREKDKSLSHLKKSINIDKNYINKARYDKDFNNIKDNPEFRRMVNPK